MKVASEKILYLFTAEYPYGYGETFLENEITILSGFFNRIIIVPYNANGSLWRKLPENVVVKNRTRSKSAIALFDIASILLYEYRHCNNKSFFRKNRKLYASYLKKAIADADFIRSIVNPADSNYFYSFWMNDWALALSVAKRKNYLDDFVFRSGGFDIWDERHEGNYIPFRAFNYKMSSGIYPNSKLAEIYLKNKGIFPEKIKCRYWGTLDDGENPFLKNQPFIIVSCSGLIPLKRVNLIAEILSHISDIKLKWIHFGDGPEHHQLEKKTNQLPPNIEVEWKGQVPNSEIKKFYKTHPVHLFITTSSTEGLPMSVQEAISYGIPVLATDVGGMKEVVPHCAGRLLNNDFDPFQAAIIMKEMLSGEINTVNFRKNVREFWKENFNAEKVYSDFAKELLSVPQGLTANSFE